MLRTSRLLFALSLSALALAPLAGARAGQDGLVNVPGINGETGTRGATAGYDYPGRYAGRFDGVDPGGAKDGAGKVNVTDGFATGNRDSAGALQPSKQRFADLPPASKPPGGNLRSLSGVGSSNELGRAQLGAAGGGAPVVDPGKPNVVYVGGSRHAAGNGNLQIGDPTSATIDPAGPYAPRFQGGVRVAVGDVDNTGGGVTGRITGVAVDPSGNTRHFNGVVDRFDAGGRGQGQQDAEAGDGNTIYVSTAGGGVWKTKDGGGTFGGHNTGALRNLSNNNMPAASGANGGVWKTTNFLTATPTPGTSTDSRAGVGVLKSTDGGRTFNQAGPAPRTK